MAPVVSSIRCHVSEELWESLHRLEQRAKDFDAKTNIVVRKVSDWVADAGCRREAFQKKLRDVQWQLSRASIQNAAAHLKEAENLWKEYIDATSGGAESILEGLCVVRNGGAAFVGTGIAALTLGAGTVMAGALATSVGTHAGFLSLSLREKEQTLPPEIVSLEYVELKSQGAEKADAAQVLRSSSNKTAAKNIKQVRKNILPRRAGKKSLETKAQSEVTMETGPRRPTGLLSMRDKSVPIEVSPPLDAGPRVIAQSAVGTYLRYEDGGALVRNPAFGPYALSKEAKVDDQIIVDASGEVSGVPIPSSISTNRIVSGTSSAELLNNVLMNVGSNVTGKVVQVIFAIDTSKSMGLARSILGEAIENTLIDLQSRLAKEIHFGVVIFRDDPAIFSPVLEDAKEGEKNEGGGIYVLEHPHSMNGRSARELGEKIKRLKLGGGQEPAGLALQKAIDLFHGMPVPAGPVLRQVIVISDHEGLRTKCGDLAYPEEERYFTIRTHSKDITVSVFLIPNNVGCGCTFPNCSQG